MPTTIPADAVPAEPPPSPGERRRVVVNAGTIVSRTFDVWRENLGRFLVFDLAMLLPLVAVVVALALAMEYLRGEVPPWIPGLVGFPVVLALMAAMIAGIAHGAIQGLAGRPVRLGAMFATGFGRLLPALGAGVVAGVGVTLGGVMLVVPGVILACGFSAVIGAVVVEGLGPIAALRRSWSLTEGHKGSVLGAAVLMFFVNLALMIAAKLLEVVPVVGLLASFALNLLTSSLQAIWPAVVYHDLRLLQEGSGIGEEELARVFE